MELSRESIKVWNERLLNVCNSMSEEDEVNALCDMALASINGPKLSRAYKKEVGRGKD